MQFLNSPLKYNSSVLHKWYESESIYKENPCCLQLSHEIKLFEKVKELHFFPLKIKLSGIL